MELTEVKSERVRESIANALALREQARTMEDMVAGLKAEANQQLEKALVELGETMVKATGIGTVTMVRNQPQTKTDWASFKMNLVKAGVAVDTVTEAESKSTITKEPGTPYTIRFVPEKGE